MIAIKDGQKWTGIDVLDLNGQQFLSIPGQYVHSRPSC